MVDNLTTDNGALDSPQDIYCYFARFMDGDGARLTAVRRASQFKGVLRSRLIRFVSDSMKLVEDSVFKLDTDFDILVASDRMHIVRPSSFEFTGRLQDVILAAVPTNIEAVRLDLPFVDWGPIEDYAAGHPRAARYLSSIRSQGQAQDVDKDHLLRLCTLTNVDVDEVDGALVIRAGSELAFLEVLDRRRYELELVDGHPERFKADSRSRLGG